mmetsp:Transcript_5899/g.13139  ORF Transcript_5899/g.13139 Transcript_5899/m.13139 type:complete len:219 (+) Transcript_5899:1069-1725(+)
MGGICVARSGRCGWKLPISFSKSTTRTKNSSRFQDHGLLILVLAGGGVGSFVVPGSLLVFGVFHLCVIFTQDNHFVDLLCSHVGRCDTSNKLRLVFCFYFLEAKKRVIDLVVVFLCHCRGGHRAWDRWCELHERERHSGVFLFDLFYFFFFVVFFVFFFLYLVALPLLALQPQLAIGSAAGRHWRLKIRAACGILVSPRGSAEGPGSISRVVWKQSVK